MKTLHLTKHVGTRKNIENVFSYLNMPEKIVTEGCIRNDYYIHKELADEIWLHYENKLTDYNCLIFTDTSMVARAFLQNIEKHNCFIIVYITNRFDWGIFGFKDEEYISLYSNVSNHNRVFFCADNNFDQYYAKNHNIHFLYEQPIYLTPQLCHVIHSNLTNKFFVYDRGTHYSTYENILKERSIEHDIFGEKYERYRNTEHICEYKGIIHLPYQTNIQSLWENLGYYIVYFIPSKKFIHELIEKEDWYYWEEKHKPRDLFEKSIELSEWYIDENRSLFEYFDSWDELEYKTKNTTDEYFMEKRENIKQFMIKSNKSNLYKWQNIFDKIL
jgi:hypothetical protein